MYPPNSWGLCGGGRAANMPAMHARRLIIRWTPWVFALALLLEAAVPMLAATAAQWQGKALAEVCTVYGVATVALDGSGGAGHEGAGAHAGEHCALGGWVVVALPGVLPVVTPGRVDVPAAPSRAQPTLRRDACAAWAARLGHGPPQVG